MSLHVLRLTVLMSAVWCALTAPALAIQSEVSAITYVDQDGDRRIFAFARGDSGHLVLNHFNGTTWHWIDHGVPAGATSVGGPKALTYVDAAGFRRIYVFVKDNTNHLALRYWNGFQWQWVHQGGPEVLGDTLSVLTYIDPSGNRRIYAFMVAGNHDHLFVNYWNGFTWQWADNGSPPDGATSTEAITYIDDNGERRIEVFVRAYVNTTFPLYVNSWTGSNWVWTNHGGSDVGSISAVTYVDTSGLRRIYAFMKRQSELWVHWWTGFAWAWTPLGVPAGQQNSILYNISALTYVDSANNRRLYAFAEFSGNLFVKYWNGFSWNWANQGLPAGHTSIQSPAAITYSQGGTQWIHVFAIGSGGDLVINYWNGSSWQWTDNGTL